VEKKIASLYSIISQLFSLCCDGKFYISYLHYIFYFDKLNENIFNFIIRLIFFGQRGKFIVKTSFLSYKRIEKT